MHDSAIALIELGAIFFGLGILGRVAWKIGISPIPFYLLGGLAFGSGGLIPLDGIEEFTSLASEIGVILLLLLLGLEYSAAELVTGLRRSWLAGLVDLVLNAAPGAAVALLLGWGPVGALAMAGVTYISSSGIIAKVLGDLGRLGNRETPVVLSILVFEDLAMAVYLPILTAVLAGATLLGGLTAIGISLVVVTLVLLLALRFGRYVSAIVDSQDPEVFLLRVLGAALLVAGVASAAAGVGRGRRVPARHRDLRVDGGERDPDAGAAAGPVRGDVLRGVRAEHGAVDDPAGAGRGRAAGAGHDRSRRS